jgi:hypothetical protein
MITVTELREQLNKIPGHLEVVAVLPLDQEPSSRDREVLSAELYDEAGETVCLIQLGRVTE